jgi:hypothetical protein
LKVGCPATEIDVGRREIKIANDESVSFSRLALAAGSAPLRLNVPGADLRANCSIPPISLSSTGSGIARISAEVHHRITATHGDARDTRP